MTHPTLHNLTVFLEFSDLQFAVQDGDWSKTALLLETDFSEKRSATLHFLLDRAVETADCFLLIKALQCYPTEKVEVTAKHFNQKDKPITSAVFEQLCSHPQVVFATELNRLLLFLFNAGCRDATLYRICVEQLYSIQQLEQIPEELAAFEQTLGRVSLFRDLTLHAHGGILRLLAECAYGFFEHSTLSTCDLLQALQSKTPLAATIQRCRKMRIPTETRQQLFRNPAFITACENGFIDSEMDVKKFLVREAVSGQRF